MVDRRPLSTPEEIQKWKISERQERMAMTDDTGGCVRCKDMLICNRCKLPITDNHIEWQMSYPPHPIHSAWSFTSDGKLFQFREVCTYRESISSPI